MAVADLGDTQGGGKVCRRQLGCISESHGERGLLSGIGQFYSGETGLVSNLMVYVARSAPMLLGWTCNHLQYVIYYNIVSFQASVCGRERVRIGWVRHGCTRCQVRVARCHAGDSRLHMDACVDTFSRLSISQTNLQLLAIA